MPDYNMLFQAPNPGASFASAFQQTRQENQQNALMQQQMAERAQDRQMKMQEMQQAATQAQIEHHRDSIILGGKIIRQLQPKDDASWQQAKAMFIQAGGDPTEVPDHFDPQYVQGIVGLANALEPQPAQSPHFVPFQQGGGVVQVNPDGTYSMVVQPNDGSHPAGSPVSGGAMPKVTDQASYDAVPTGSQYMTPDGHIRVKGGQSRAPSTGGF